MDTTQFHTPVLDLVYPPAMAWSADEKQKLFVSRANYIESRTNAARSTSKPAQTPGQVAVIEMLGPFFPEDSIRFTDLVNRARENDSVGLIVYINSPGGSSSMGQEANDALHRFSQVKPSIAICEGLCTSLAYWFACGCSSIVASPSTVIGSIGTRMVLVDSSKLVESAGLKVIPIATGKYKTAGQDGTPITEDQIGYFQGLIDELQKPFAAAVMRGRKMDARKVKDLADARVYSAPQAFGLGLIDRIATVDDAIAEFVNRVAAPQQVEQRSQSTQLSYAQAVEIYGRSMADKMELMKGQAALIASFGK